MISRRGCGTAVDVAQRFVDRADLLVVLSNPVVVDFQRHQWRAPPSALSSRAVSRQPVLGEASAKSQSVTVRHLSLVVDIPGMCRIRIGLNGGLKADELGFIRLSAQSNANVPGAPVSEYRHLGACRRTAGEPGADPYRGLVGSMARPRLLVVCARCGKRGQQAT